MWESLGMNDVNDIDVRSRDGCWDIFKGEGVWVTALSLHSLGSRMQPVSCGDGVRLALACAESVTVPLGNSLVRPY
jgi:hypothetical protein